MDKRDQWRVGFAKQARADLAARDVLLRESTLPACQQLNFLQMACEKVCKAHLCHHGSDPADLQHSHAYIEKPLPVIVRQQLGNRAVGRHSWIVPAIRAIARRIELLAPAVDADGTHPANCEYPWMGPGNRVIVPAEHRFAIDLSGTAGRTLLKVITAAVAELVGP